MKAKENNQIKSKKRDLKYLDCPNLTEEKRQQLGHVSYPEPTPEFVRSSYNSNAIIKELKEKIQKLINITNALNTEQKNRLNYLFRKLDEIKEIETLEHLKKQAGDKFLKAYLLYKSISRANYQPEHLEITNFKNVDRYLEAIDKDIELVRREIEPEPKSSELSNEKLLTLLGERLQAGEVKRCDLEDENNTPALYIAGEGNDQQEGFINRVLTLNLNNFKLEPDRIKELLEKHGWNEVQRTAKAKE